MPLRRLLRGRVPEATLERVAHAVAERRGEPLESLEPLEADNWLSTPCVVNGRYFLKVVSPQNAAVHGMLTASRNLGLFSSGTVGFFEHFETPRAMVEHELAATAAMREAGVNVPEPLEAFRFEDLGVLVLEFVRDLEPIDRADPATVERVLPELFGTLARMHEAGLVHGDIRAENVLVADGEVFLIDPTKVADAAREAGEPYDLACALATVAPLLDARAAVAAAREEYDDATLVGAIAFLDFVKMRPDHEFDAATLKGEIGTATA